MLFIQTNNIIIAYIVLDQPLTDRMSYENTSTILYFYYSILR